MIGDLMPGGRDLVEVLGPGALTTIQDSGRRGFAHLGVPRSGAADLPALRLANRLVGNPPDAPALETTLTGPRLRLLGSCTIAVTGATVMVHCLAADGVRRGLPMNTPVRLHRGDEIRLGSADEGLRSYVAFGGGIVAERVLGSASTDLLTGLGPARLSAGDRLRVGPPPSDPRPAGDASIAFVAPGPETFLRVVLGPRADWFTEDALEQLTGAAFEVTPSSNRIGVRFAGPPLARGRERELPSEGIVPGCIQVPGDGQPIVLGMDHPTTGGYPVIAVVVSDDLPLIGQLRPGQHVRFTAVLDR